jgi:hypothetical protein
MYVEDVPSVHLTVQVDFSLLALYQVLQRLHRRSLLGTFGSPDGVFSFHFLLVGSVQNI